LTAVRVLLKPGRVRREPHALVHLIELRLAGAVYLGRQDFQVSSFPGLIGTAKASTCGSFLAKGRWLAKRTRNRCVRAMRVTTSRRGSVAEAERCSRVAIGLWVVPLLPR
jgi:hypothetical protein